MSYKYVINPFSGGLQKVLDESMIHMKDAIATYNDLPVTGNAENDARFVKDTDILYVWSIANATGNLTDWKETAKLSVADLDALPDGSTYGRIKNTEIESGQVKRLDDGTNEVEASDAKDAVDKKHPHANKATLDLIEEALTSALKLLYDGAVTDKHTHSNKTVLDAIQEAFTTTLKNKLDGIEGSATADQTGIEIKNLLEALTGTDKLSLVALKETDTYKLFTNTLLTKLNGIEEAATADQSDTEVRDLLAGLTGADKLSLEALKETATYKYFTATLLTKLNAIEESAKDDQTATEIRGLLETLTGADRLNADNVKEGATNKFFNGKTEDDLPAGTTNKKFTDTEKTKLSNIEESAVALATVKADTDIADAISKKHIQNEDTVLVKSILDQHGDLSGGEYAIFDNQWMAQTFKAGISGLLTKVTLKLRRIGSPPSDLTIEIRNVVPGTPAGWQPGSTIHASEVISSGDISESQETMEIVFTNPYSVTSETIYAIVLRTTGGDEYSNSYMVAMDFDGVYPDGDMVLSSDAGSSWWVYSNMDFYFKTYIGGTVFDNGELKDNLSVSAGKKIGTKTIEDYQDAVDKKHSQNTDTQLGAMAADINMNTHQLGGLAVPDANGEAIRQTTKITEVNLEDAMDKRQSKDMTLTFIIDGGGVEIADGIAGDLEIPFAGTIKAVTMLADQSGSVVVDIWKDTYANFPPLDGDSITASAVPTITTATKSQDTTLSGWTTAIAAGDILRFSVDSCTNIQRLTISLKIEKS